MNLTDLHSVFNIPRLMSANLPDTVDAARMIAARRYFQGILPLEVFLRLQNSLVDTHGECEYSLQFDQDNHQTSYVEITISTALPLQCQRTLQRFLYPIHIQQRLGLIRSEAEENGLAPEYEPFLIPSDGMLNLADLIEDELVLALPVIAISPDSAPVEHQWLGAAPEQEDVPANPFAVLAALKKPR